MRILIADDNEQIRMLVATALRSLEHELVMAADGEEALALATADPPDLLLLDVQMPAMDGFEVLSRLRAQPATKDLRVIMLTADAQAVDKIHGAELGANGYVVKPFAPSALRETVSRALDQQP